MVLVLVVLNGPCIDYRIASSSKRTILGLPEEARSDARMAVLTIYRLIGYQAALDCILTGKNLKPDKAKKLGLVDMVVDLPS